MCAKFFFSKQYWHSSMHVAKLRLSQRVSYLARRCSLNWLLSNVTRHTMLTGICGNAKETSIFVGNSNFLPALYTVNIYLKLSHTVPYIIVDYPDKKVSVWSALFVPSPQGMKHLVNHDPLAFTALPNGDVLRSSSTANKGETPATKVC